jgi:hypothetical protein
MISPGLLSFPRYLESESKSKRVLVAKEQESRALESLIYFSDY